MLKDTTRCRLWGSNPGPLDLESDALPLRHRAPLRKILTGAKLLLMSILARLLFILNKMLIGLETNLDHFPCTSLSLKCFLFCFLKHLRYRFSWAKLKKMFVWQSLPRVSLGGLVGRWLSFYFMKADIKKFRSPNIETQFQAQIIWTEKSLIC